MNVYNKTRGTLLYHLASNIQTIPDKSFTFTSLQTIL